MVTSSKPNPAARTLGPCESRSSSWLRCVPACASARRADAQDAQDPTATATATPTGRDSGAHAHGHATPAPTEPATPAPVDPVPAAPTAEQTRGARGRRRQPTAAPTATPAATAAPPSADRTPAPPRRRAHAPNTERRAGSVEPHATATPAPRRPHGAAHPAIAPTTLGPAAVAVPNFFIDRFRIPPFLLPIYQAAGTQYGVRWEVLAAINEIETDYGRNLDVSSAGALGWMQFMPATWKQYGVDANRDGVKDPFNPVDAIFASARYLRAAGAARDLRRAIFAYNHADWYVDSVLLRARVVGGLPSGLVSSLTGLTQGAFPVRGRATYARQAAHARPRRGIDVYAGAGAAVIAVADGRVSKLGQSSVRLQDVFGNTYTYAHLGTVARTYPAPRRRRTRPARRSRSGRQAAPVRASEPAGRAVRRRGAATGRRRAPQRRVRPARLRAQAAARRRAGDRGHANWAGSGARQPGGAAPALRDPARRARRPADRPEADPRRLEAARVDRHLPRARRQAARRPRRRPGARSARSC